ncbi:MAG: tRNA nucleotidyltransferase/poly(A) polymerase family protein [Planctomycetota bacterium]|jgi:tRNA nucleotidyltransferase (CCA-adding enzyme)
MLRAVRFSTKLGFAIEPRTFSAISSGAKNITKISAERIAAELEAILANPNRSVGASLLAKTGLAEAIFPGFSPRQISFGTSVLGELRKKVDFPLALACFLAGCPTKSALEKSKRLKLSRNQSKHIKFLLTNIGKLLNEKMSLAELKLTLAEPYFRDLYELQKAIQKAKHESAAPLSKLTRRIKGLRGVELKPRPLLDGHDLIELGATPGPGLGQLTEEMYIAQLEGQLQTTQQAKEWVRKWLQKHRGIDN